MSPSQPDDPKTGLKAKLFEWLHDPLHLRAAVTGTVVLVAYLGIYTPLSGQIEQTGAEVRHARKLLELAVEVESLRSQYQSFRGRLPKQSDPNEWVQYVLGGLRRFPLKLAALDCDPPRGMGPYKAVVMRMELEGGFFAMDAFLRWLESNERLFRLDSLKIAPSRSGNEIQVMQITLLGVMG